MADTVSLEPRSMTPTHRRLNWCLTDIGSVSEERSQYEDRSAVTTGTTDYSSSPDQVESDASSRDSERSAGAHNFRVSQFAERSHLSQWFPQIEDDENNSRRIYFSHKTLIRS
ncbi:hypothetical protein F5Y06DRAFT_293108 [Hypoxylon sp. FL0890]|nr:hypothetical protein F5Y06DRAFT_293108 [Hypoxylon sp. FL0890]